MSTIYLEKTDIGATLTTWVYCAMWQLYTLEHLGHRAYINWPRDRLRWLGAHWDDTQFANQPNAFEWYFEQPHFTHGERPRRELTWTWEPPHDATIHQLAAALGTHPLYTTPDNIRSFYKKNVRLNTVVRARGDALMARYQLDPAHTLAVAWRGTDCVLDGRPRLPIEVYFPFIDEILANDPGLRILATAEEQGILSPLLTRYPQAFTIAEWMAAPHGAKDNPEKIFTSTPGFERGMQPALMVYILSRCRYLIKNRASVTSVASWLSDGHIVCLAHPENLGHGFDLTKAEIKGQLYPLYR
jgi:hypothetical protein